MKLHLRKRRSLAHIALWARVPTRAQDKNKVFVFPPGRVVGECRALIPAADAFLLLTYIYNIRQLPPNSWHLLSAGIYSIASSSPFHVLPPFSSLLPPPSPPLPEPLSSLSSHRNYKQTCSRPSSSVVEPQGKRVLACCGSANYIRKDRREAASQQQTPCLALSDLSLPHRLNPRLTHFPPLRAPLPSLPPLPPLPAQGYFLYAPASPPPYSLI